MGEAEGSSVTFSLLVVGIKTEDWCIYAGFLCLPAVDCWFLQLVRVLTLVTVVIYTAANVV